VSDVEHDLIILPQAQPFSGSVPAPPDQDLSHLALLVAAIAEGESAISHLSSGSDVESLCAALRGLGVAIEDSPGAPTRVVGRGVRGFVDPGAPIACGSSLSTLRRLAALLVAHPFKTVLTAEPSSAFAAMTDVASALRRRAAQIEGAFATSRAGEMAPPFTLGPLPAGHALSGVEYAAPMARTDVKEALLLSGLSADEATYVREPLVSCDHLERMLAALDVPVTGAGSIVSLDPENWDGKIAAFSFEVPGDPAFASLLVGLGSMIRESQVTVRGVGLNASRAGAFELLRQMGGAIDLVPQATRLGEAEGMINAMCAPLRGVTMDGEPWHHASDDWPVLVALAARARGVSEIARPPSSDVRGVRSTATERAESVALLLRAFGVEAESAPHGGIVVSGRPEGALEGADVDVAGDAERATLAVMLGFVARGQTRVRRIDAWAARFPRIVGTLRALGADVRVERREG
jgi:3-phosphoshikimate 1-carboxyvinyltransferase